MNILKKAYYRGFQACLKVGNYFLSYRVPEIKIGPGNARMLPKFILSKGVDNVLVVTDSSLMKQKIPNPMLKAMDQVGVKYTIYDGVSPNPTSLNVENGLRVYQTNGCRGVVAIGGGSPIDCAKAIGARIARPNRTVAQMQGILKVRHRGKIPPLFAIPTTAGTGSETTVAAVIIDSITQRKASINDTVILPNYAVLDPELTISLPPFITATTGMDALCHAVEAYTNHTYNTKLEDQYAEEAVKLIYDNLLTVYHDGQNLVARQNMQIAAFKAGRAFTRGCVGYVHAIGHTLSGLYNTPHGLAMSILLPHVMREFGTAVYIRLARLADVCQMGEGSNEEKALRFIHWIESMKQNMDIPEKLDMVKPEDIPKMITWAMEEAHPLYPVPVLWGREQFRRFLEKVCLI